MARRERRRSTYAGGSIDEVRAGVFRLRVRVAGKRVTIGSYPSREEARRAMLGARCARDDGDWRPGREMSLADYGKEVLDRWELSAYLRGTAKDRSVWRAHITGSGLAGTMLHSPGQTSWVGFTTGC